jgi:hypothetical protein
MAVFDAQDELGPRVMINPEVIETAGELEYEEGCLSVPGHYWEITRPAFVRVKALDLEGNEIEYAGDGLLGRVLQHEADHLDGGLLLDHLPKRLRKRALKDTGRGDRVLVVCRVNSVCVSPSQRRHLARRTAPSQPGSFGEHFDAARGVEGRRHATSIYETGH